MHAIRADGGLLGGYGLRRLATSRGRSASRSFFYLENFGELLHYGRGGLFDGTYRWQRLTERGLEDIEGGAIGTLSFDRQENGWLVRTPTLGGAVLGGDDALYFYDGVAVRPLAGGELTRIGKSPVIRPLAGIGRVLVSSSSGVFEISPEKSVAAVELPFPTAGVPPVRFADWPEADAAFASTADGLFVVDENLNAVRLLDERAFPPAWLEFTAGAMRETGEIALVTKGRMFLAVDTARAGSTACQGAP